MKKLFILLAALITMWSCNTNSECKNPTRLSEYVSTLVGTQSEGSISTGNTYPAVALPWGMNFWTPQTGSMGDGWAYTYTSHTIRGFKQTHQPSPWINDYGQFSIMPVNGNDKMDENSRQSWFSHQAEEAHPYFYSVYFADHDIFAEMTPTDRAAVMRFTFPETAEAGIVIDAFNNGSMIKVVDENTIVGYTTRNSGGVPDNFKNWFVARFDKPFEAVEMTNDPANYKAGSDIMKVEAKELQGEHAMAKVHFNTKRGDKVEVRVASSFISEEQAFHNLGEVAEKTFAQVQADAQNRWDEILGRVEIEGGNLDQMRTFYSCLYRATLFPRKFYEFNEKNEPIHYSPYNGKVLPGYMYTDSGFWDTFRSLFPLLNLIYPSVNTEIQAGLANTYRESGFLPEWASPGHRGCMVGNNSASIVSDAILKGIAPKEDINLLYEAMMHGRTHVMEDVNSTGRLGHEYYNTLGYVPSDVDINESAARTLEYAYDDWCIAQVSKLLGKTEDAEMLEKASQNYKNLYDPEHKLMRGRMKNGEWKPDFNPYKWGDVFTEGNAWHYTWSVFHDPEGLAELMGGKEEFAKQLDAVFTAPPIYDDSYYGFRIHEIVEMQIANMGNYAHGNQPAQHMIYLYDYCGKPWQAQWWTREVMNKLYSAKPDGYCGDEDNGQTSAWYVFSALGFYPVCPASDEYAVGSPLFDKATIHLENGKEIVIEAKNNNNENRYISSLKVNGNESDNFLKYSELIKGAKLSFSMQAEPNKTRGTEGRKK